MGEEEKEGSELEGSVERENESVIEKEIERKGRTRGRRENRAFLLWIKEERERLKQK